MRDPAKAVIQGFRGDARHECAAGAVARDRKGLPVPAQAPAVLGGPPDHSIAVVEAGREGGLGCETVADRDDLVAGFLGQGPCNVVVGVQAAQEERAAVEVHQQAVGIRVDRRVDPHGHVAGWGRGRDIIDGVQRESVRERSDVCGLARAHGGRVQRRTVGSRQSSKDPRNFGMDGHGVSPEPGPRASGRGRRR